MAPGEIEQSFGCRVKKDAQGTSGRDVSPFGFLPALLFVDEQQDVGEVGLGQGECLGFTGIEVYGRLSGERGKVDGEPVWRRGHPIRNELGSRRVLEFEEDGCGDEDPTEETREEMGFADQN